MPSVKHFQAMNHLKASMIYFGAVVLVSALISHFFYCPFWMTFCTVLFSLAVVGIIAEWEDNQPGGWTSPD